MFRLSREGLAGPDGPPLKSPFLNEAFDLLWPPGEMCGWSLFSNFWSLYFKVFFPIQNLAFSPNYSSLYLKAIRRSRAGHYSAFPKAFFQQYQVTIHPACNLEEFVELQAWEFECVPPLMFAPSLILCLSLPLPSQWYDELQAMVFIQFLFLLNVVLWLQNFSFALFYFLLYFDV